MIVTMKKVTLFMSSREKEAAVKKLRKLGVIHVHYVKKPESEDIELLESKVSKINRILNIINEWEISGSKKSHNPYQMINEFLELNNRKRELKHTLQELEKTKEWFEKWGKVSLESITEIQQRKVFLHFYILDKKNYKNFNDRDNVQFVKEEKGRYFIIFFSDSTDNPLDFKEEPMPQVDYAKLQKEIKEIHKKIDQIDKKLFNIATCKKSFITYKSEVEKRIEFNTVVCSMGEKESFLYLQGFCPEKRVDLVKQEADKEDWGYMFEEPDDPGQVPTLLENPKAFRIVEPVYKFMGILPGYKEIDISFVFLVFFSLFYAMIIGDAGYGVLFLLGIIISKKIFKKAPDEPFILFGVLSISTIIWGTLTGTWFGSQYIAEQSFFKHFIIDPIYSFDNSRESIRYMMRFTFILALIQLSIGHLMVAYRNRKNIKALADIGWVLIIVGMFFVTNLLVLNYPLPAFATPLLIAGFLLVTLFTNFQKNIFKAFFGSVFTVLLDIIGSFSDIVSYVRLFAVGVATVAVASAFNSMASGFLAPIILVLGHGLNILLAIMSVLVHGIRLNVLEFSTALGQEWSGIEYKPFKESNSDKINT
ncbi:MAG: hypothetical protein R6V04_12215 [bacterium]